MQTAPDHKIHFFLSKKPDLESWDKPRQGSGSSLNADPVLGRDIATWKHVQVRKRNEGQCSREPRTTRDQKKVLTLEEGTETVGASLMFSCRKKREASGRLGKRVEMGSSQNSSTSKTVNATRIRCPKYFDLWSESTRDSWVSESVHILKLLTLYGSDRAYVLRSATEAVIMRVPL